MKQKFLVALLFFIFVFVLSACDKTPSVSNIKNEKVLLSYTEKENVTSIDKHLGEWWFPNEVNDLGDHYIKISKEAGEYRLHLDMSSSKILYYDVVLSVNEHNQTATSIVSSGYSGFDDGFSEDDFDIDVKWNEEKLWIKREWDEHYIECYRESKSEKSEPFRDANWPSNADDSWERFYSYGGIFFINEYNSWICNIGNSAIVWEGNRWTYTSKSGDFFVQYEDSDYFNIDTSDMYYSFNMNSLTGWVMVTSKGIVPCDEPQLFRDDVEKLKKAVYDSNLNSKIEAFRSMGFNCYEEDGTWKCDTQSGVLTYYNELREWHGVVNIYNPGTDSWEYNVNIMVPNASLTGDELFRYADGRDDKGVHSHDSDTDLTGMTYSIKNYGIKGTKIYNENVRYLDAVGMSDFVGFWI